MEKCDQLNEKIDKLDNILEETGAYEHFRDEAEEDWDESGDDDFGDDPIEDDDSEQEEEEGETTEL